MRRGACPVLLLELHSVHRASGRSAVHPVAVHRDAAEIATEVRRRAAVHPLGVFAPQLLAAYLAEHPDEIDRVETVARAASGRWAAEHRLAAGRSAPSKKELPPRAARRLVRPVETVLSRVLQDESASQAAVASPPERRLVERLRARCSEMQAVSSGAGQRLRELLLQELPRGQSAAATELQAGDLPERRSLEVEREERPRALRQAQRSRALRTAPVQTDARPVSPWPRSSRLPRRLLSRQVRGNVCEPIPPCRDRASSSASSYR